jgi:hypothetical protein
VVEIASVVVAGVMVVGGVELAVFSTPASMVGLEVAVDVLVEVAELVEFS